MQNLFTGNLLANLRGRINAVIGVVITSVAFCLCGALMTFVLAPQQALKAYRISQMPLMDADFVGDAAAGSDLLITGYLQGEVATRSLPDFIAYTEEKWNVTVTKDSDGKENSPSGSWSHQQTVVPALTLAMNGAPINILSANNANLSGDLHEKIMEGSGTLQAKDGDKMLRDGALRYSGFFNGDLATVFGKKASVGGMVPEELFAGDRVAFESYQKKLASTYLYMGIMFMLCSPLVLVIGTLGVIFGRKR